jgi:hypothetical protein
MNFPRTINFSILTAFLFITSLCSYSQEDSSKKAKEIYAKAKDNYDKLNYKTVSEKKEKNGGITSIIFHKVNPDGTVFIRRENTIEPKSQLNPLNPNIEIINEQGQFQLIPIEGKAFKMDFQLGTKEIDETGLNISYALSERDYNETLCYVVTKRIEPNQLAYERYVEALPSEMQAQAKESKKNFETFFAAVTVFYIAKSDNFFRKRIRYGARGKLLGAYEWGEVVINPVFGEGLFKVPDTYAIQILHSSKEAAKASSEIIEKEVKLHAKPIAIKKAIPETNPK